MSESEEAREHHKKRVPDFLNVPWTIRDVLIFVVAWFGAQVLLGVWLGIVGMFVPAVGEFVRTLASGDLVVSFVFNLLDAFIGLGVVWLLLRKYKAKWSALGWHKVSVWKSILYLVLILVAFILLAGLALEVVTRLVPGFNPDQPQENEFIEGAKQHYNIALFALVLIPPILEETIFRGFVFPAIAKRTGLIWGAVLSSALFGVAHAQANVGVYTFVLGLLLCFMYVRLRSIIPGIFLHMLNNYIAFMALTSGK